MKSGTVPDREKAMATFVRRIGKRVKIPHGPAAVTALYG